MAATPLVPQRAGSLNIEIEQYTGLAIDMYIVNGTTSNQINLTGHTLEADVKRSLCGPEALTVLASPTVSVTGVAEVQTITTVADVAGSLGGTYFDYDSALVEYRVWIDVDNGSSAPTAAGRTLVEVDISADDTAPTVATAVKTALDALGDVGAAVASNIVTVTNDDDGFVPPAVDGALATGFTCAVSTLGSQLVTLTFSEADIIAIDGDAYWDLRTEPPTGLPWRLVEGEIIWFPGSTEGS